MDPRAWRGADTRGAWGVKLREPLVAIEAVKGNSIRAAVDRAQWWKMTSCGFRFLFMSLSRFKASRKEAWGSKLMTRAHVYYIPTQGQVGAGSQGFHSEGWEPVVCLQKDCMKWGRLNSLRRVWVLLARSLMPGSRKSTNVHHCFKENEQELPSERGTPWPSEKGQKVEDSLKHKRTCFIYWEKKMSTTEGSCTWPSGWVSSLGRSMEFGR